MLLIVMVKLSPVNITNEIKGTQRENTTVETDTVLSVSQTLRSDQPIHGGDRQTFEMETLFMNPFVSHWLALSNPGRPAILSVP